MSGAATSSRVHEDPPRPPSRNEKICAEVRPGDVHRHRQQRGKDRADRVAREQQPRETPGPAGAAEAGGRAGTRSRRAPANASPCRRPNSTTTSRTGMRTAMRGAEGRPRCGAEDVRIGQRVSDQALEGRACDGESRAHEHGREDARDAQVPRRSSRWRPTRTARGRAPACRHTMTPSRLAGLIRADPNVTPPTSSTASATSPAAAIRPGRARMRSARPSVPRSGESAVRDTFTSGRWGRWEHDGRDTSPTRGSEARSADAVPGG